MASKEIEVAAAEHVVSADHKARVLAEIEQLRPDLYMPEDWTPDERESAVELVTRQRVRTGMMSNIPMKCRAAKCEFAEICPYMEKNMAPEGKPCPLEMAQVQMFYQNYLEEFGVSPDNLVEVSIIRDMVDQHIQLMRKTKILSLEYFIQENVVGLDGEGEPIIQKQLHQAVDYEDKIMRRLEKLRSAMLATREMRAKVGLAQLDNSQKMANALDAMKQKEYEYQQKLDNLTGDIFKDEYIEEAELLDDEDYDPEDDDE